MSPDAAERGSVVDFAAAKRRLDDPKRLPCPRCGRKVDPAAGRCPHCGVWFAGEALAPRFSWGALARRLVTWALLALLAALTLVGIYATFFAPGD